MERFIISILVANHSGVLSRDRWRNGISGILPDHHFDARR